MAKLVELNNKTHGKLKIVENCVVAVAEDQHILGVKVTEVGPIASNFPIFINKIGGTDDWALSAIAGLELNSNLFVEDNQWLASCVPTSMQTFPLFLMNAPEGKKGFAVAIDEEDKRSFSETEGIAMFDDQGQPTEAVKRMSEQLEADIKNNMHTYKFIKKMEELELLKAVDVLVYYTDRRLNTLKGLHTIDEEKVQALSIEKFDELRKAGYIPAIYAILISVFQLNALIHRHNLRAGAAQIHQVKMEDAKAGADAGSTE